MTDGTSANAQHIHQLAEKLNLSYHRRVGGVVPLLRTEPPTLRFLVFFETPELYPCKL